MKNVSWIVLGCLVLTTGHAAGFDCKKAATKIEHLICEDEQASDLDEKLHKAYVEAFERRSDKQNLIQEQKLWLKEIRNLCQDALCISLATQYRIDQLFEIEHGMERHEIDAVDMDCDENKGRLALSYSPIGDDINSSLVALHNCPMGHSDYKILVFRGMFKESGHCAENPPIFIWIFRNSKPVVVQIKLGENCYGGPSLVSIELREAKEKLGPVKLCFHPSFDDEPICKVITNVEKALPISEASFE